MERKFTLPSFGYEVVLGKFADQADSAAWLQCGGTIVLATVDYLHTKVENIGH